MAGCFLGVAELRSDARSCSRRLRGPPSEHGRLREGGITRAGVVSRESRLSHIAGGGKMSNPQLLRCGKGAKGRGMDGTGKLPRYGWCTRGIEHMHTEGSRDITIHPDLV